MQDLVTDKLASKHIPAISRPATGLPATGRPAASPTAALPHVIATDLVPSLQVGGTYPAATTYYPQSLGAKPAVPAFASASTTQTRVYTGSMTLGGSFTDSQDQSGNWVGTLKENLIVTVDANGNGTGYESFTGTLGATVHNPDGSTKNTTPTPFNFILPVFTINAGHFTVSQSDSVGFEGLALTLTVNGTLNTSSPTASVNLNIPFNGRYEGVDFNGSITGSSSIRTPPLALSGAAARQAAYAGSKMTPFQNLYVTDLNGVPVTATVLLSNAAHGTLVNLGGGKYDRATGIYTITGGIATVNHALNGLQFAPNGKLAGTLPTGFTLRISDSKGGSLINKTTSVFATNPLSIKGVFANQGVKAAKTIAPFRTVTIGDRLGSQTDSVKITLSNPANGTLTNLGGGLYNKKTGVYIVKGNASTVTNALRGLVFDPSGAAGKSTSFTITAVNGAGASVTNSKASVNTKVTTPATAVALFGQYIAAGLHGVQDHAAGISAPHELPASVHTQLAVSH